LISKLAGVYIGSMYALTCTKSTLNPSRVNCSQSIQRHSDFEDFDYSSSRQISKVFMYCLSGLSAKISIEKKILHYNLQAFWEYLVFVLQKLEYYIFQNKVENTIPYSFWYDVPVKAGLYRSSSWDQKKLLIIINGNIMNLLEASH